ncbi:MAG: hypothetical protein KJ893_05950 [Candidatus Omnitrophica bacterium]|nr:hypothetical protein [Candidatus Omnitrophota bacterium]MBU4479584.1 hypothetical protein [Candidatus Omnitrophota bacterium]MCG2703718.1 hypothetical protein [Candidatus Omnitrophota bacterium]
MRKIILYLLLVLFILPGCATLNKKSRQLNLGLSQEKVIELWGKPADKMPIGITEQNYPVEIWEYTRKSFFMSKKKELCALIFVDKELYFWAVNDHKRIMEELVKLGVVKEPPMDFELYQYRKSLDDAATQAEQTRKTNETIRTYEFYKNTQMQIEHQRQMQTIQQQQMRPPVIPPAQPVRPVQQRQ